LLTKEQNCNIDDEIFYSDESDEEEHFEPKLDNSEVEEEQYEKKDAVKKWQFQYNRSTCFSNNYPEISYKGESSNHVTVAPGENKTPTNILSEKDWDIKSFPCLHPNGENSLHSERKIKLSDQEYLTQRTMI